MNKIRMLPDRPITAVAAAEIAGILRIPEKQIEDLARRGVIFGQKLSDGRVYVSRDVINVLPELIKRRSSSGQPRRGQSIHREGSMNPKKYSGGRPLRINQVGGTR